MRRQPIAALGHPVAQMYGTLVYLYSIIDACNATSHQHTSQELQIQLNSFPQLYLFPRKFQRIISVKQSQTVSLYLHTQSQLFPTFLLNMTKKNSKKDRHTPQPRHPCTKFKQDNNHWYFPSAYITIITKSKITSSYTPPCTSSESGLIHCILY